MIGSMGIKKNSMRWKYGYPILFALAYSQDALFSSNQNTKFISGLALAKYRDIAADWMAAATDPFPIFSTVLKWQYQWLGLYFGIHFSFFLIAAVYGIAGVWLAKSMLGGTAQKKKILWVFSVIWLLIHTVIIRNIFLDVFPEGLAGQDLLGPYYQPSVFGVLLLVAIALYSSRRLMPAAFCIVLASEFHPAYIVSSILVAVGLTVLPANKQYQISLQKRLFFLLPIAVILTAYALWIADRLTFGDPLLRNKAHQLLAEIRIPHHTNPFLWSYYRTTMFFAVGLAASWIGRKQLIGQLLFVLLVLVAMAIFVTLVSNNPTVAIVAPWRVSVFLAPISWIIVITTLAKWSIEKVKKIPEYFFKRFQKATIILMLLAGSIGIATLFLNYQQKKQQSYYGICRFLEVYHTSGNQYLVPLYQKSIRLEAGVPVYVTWKSHPTKDNEFLAWYKRIEIAAAIYEKPLQSAEASNLLKKNAITHIIWPKSKGNFPFSNIAQQAYADRYYSLWEIK